MTKFISDLDMYCTEHLPPTRDAEYETLSRRHQEMEARITQALGQEFTEEFGLAFYELMEWELLDHFREGLRFGLRLALETLI